MSDPSLAFIGAGNMAGAMIGGLAAKGFAVNEIWAADPVADNLNTLNNQYGINTTADNEEAISHADVVILAVKPQLMHLVSSQIQVAIEKHQPLIISIAAGITISSLQKWLGENLAIVRCMPNTPALVQAGATALFANAHVMPEQKQWADQLLGAIGIASWVGQENELDAVTALSGSGPAYFFLVMEAMQLAGEQMGLAPELVERLTQQTALGAAKMVQQGDVGAAELRRRVSSPGGTTLAALDVFEAADLKGIFKKALNAAELRSRELALELDA